MSSPLGPHGARCSRGADGLIIKKKPRAMQERQQRSVVIGRQRVKAVLDSGEVLLE